MDIKKPILSQIYKLAICSLSLLILLGLIFFVLTPLSNYLNETFGIKEILGSYDWQTPLIIGLVVYVYGLHKRIDHLTNVVDRLNQRVYSD